MLKLLKQKSFSFNNLNKIQPFHLKSNFITSGTDIFQTLLF